MGQSREQSGSWRKRLNIDERMRNMTSMSSIRRYLLAGAIAAFSGLEMPEPPEEPRGRIMDASYQHDLQMRMRADELKVDVSDPDQVEAAIEILDFDESLLEDPKVHVSEILQWLKKAFPHHVEVRTTSDSFYNALASRVEVPMPAFEVYAQTHDPTDLRDDLLEIDRYVQSFQEPAERKFIQDAYAVQLKERVDLEGVTVSFDDRAEATFWVRQPLELDSTNIVYSELLDPRQVDDIEADLLWLVDVAHERYPNAAAGIDAYYEQIQFDPETFPTDVTVSNEMYIGEQLSRLQNLRQPYYGNGIAETYARQLRFRDLPEVTPDNFFDCSNIFFTRYEEFSNHTGRFLAASTIPELIAQQATYVQFPSEASKEHFAIFEQVAPVLSSGRYAQHTYDMLVEAARPMREDIWGGDAITPANIIAGVRQLEKLAQEIPEQNRQQMEMLLVPKKWEGEFHFSVVEPAQDDEVIYLKEIMNSSIGQDILANFSVSDGATVTFVDAPTVVNRNTIDDVIAYETMLYKGYPEPEQAESTYPVLRSQAFDMELSIEEEAWKHPRTWRQYEQAAIRLGKLRNVSLQVIDMTDLPAVQLEFGRSVQEITGIHLGRVPAFYLADYTDLPLRVSPYTLEDIATQYSLFEVEDGWTISRQYLAMLDFSAFPSRVTEDNIDEVADAVRLLQNVGGQEFVKEYGEKFDVLEKKEYAFPPVITNENLDDTVNKLMLINAGIATKEYLGLDKPKIDVQFEKPKNIQDLLIAQQQLNTLIRINETEALRLAEEYYLLVDWQAILGDFPLDNIHQVETLRKRVNAAVSASAGDRFLINLGVYQIERSEVSWDTLDQRVQFAETYLQAGTEFESDYSIGRDVIGIYHMLGNFQVTRIIEFMLKEDRDLEDGDIAPMIQRLRDAGANIPEEQSKLAKILRSIDDPKYIVKKGIDKVSSSDALRDQWTEIAPEIVRTEKVLAEGFEFNEIRIDGEVVAQVLFADPSKGARVEYMVKVGGGLTEQHIQEQFYSQTVVAEAVGAYTTGPGKPTELTINDGRVENYLISSREGMLLADSNGRMQIIDRTELTTQHIDSGAELARLDFAERLEDFKRLVDLSRKTKLDVMMGHLLVRDGQLRVGENSSATVDKRRAVAVTVDGRYAIVDFTQSVTLLEASVIMQASGIADAINLDTGYYDHANVYTVDGERMELGAQDKDGTNNKLVFYRE